MGEVVVDGIELSLRTTNPRFLGGPLVIRARVGDKGRSVLTPETPSEPLRTLILVEFLPRDGAMEANQHRSISRSRAYRPRLDFPGGRECSCGRGTVRMRPMHRGACEVRTLRGVEWGGVDGTCLSLAMHRPNQPMADSLVLGGFVRLPSKSRVIEKANWSAVLTLGQSVTRGCGVGWLEWCGLSTRGSRLINISV